jgi:hypothetical protein
MLRENYDSQESFDFYQESHDEARKLGIERWDEALDENGTGTSSNYSRDEYDDQYHHETPI